MPDLSAYISFEIEMDIRNKNVPEWLLTDNGTYPPGVDAGITGIFEITQPDGGVYTGSWTSPDIIYSGGALQPASIALRLTSTGNVIQPGNYIIKYTIDHASYSPTILTKNFTVAYTAPTAVLTESFDVFVPELSISDDTVYNPSGYTTFVDARDWEAVIGTVGVKNGTAQVLDLSYLGDYYDASYVITLIADFHCDINSGEAFTVRDRITTIVDTDAWTPPDADTLLGYLKTLKTNLDALINSCQRYDRAKADYEYALVLYTHIKARVCSGDTVGVYTYIQEILDILHNHASIPTVHTEAIIPAYDYGALCTVGATHQIQNLLYVVDGSETQETVPSDYMTFVISGLIGKTLLTAHLDGIERVLTQGGAPVVLPTDGTFHFETALGKFYYTPTLNIDQYIQILYYI